MVLSLWTLLSIVRKTDRVLPGMNSALRRWSYGRQVREGVRRAVRQDAVPPPDYGWIQCCDIPLILELRHILVAKISSAAAAANAKAGKR